MKEFSKLVRRQRGHINMGALIIATGVAMGSAYALYDYRQDQNLVAGLKDRAAQMQSEKSSMDKMRSYFKDEGGRIETSHRSNLELLQKAGGVADWLPALPGSPTIEELKTDEAAKYIQSKDLLTRQSAGAEAVWAALNNPEKIDVLKAGLTPENLGIYSAVKECAARGAGEGAYCGPSAAVNARLTTILAQTTKLQEESEAFARQNLGLGWDDWDTAEGNLNAQALKDINSARDKAQVAFDNGDLNEDDWNDLNNGFVAARATATAQIHQDRQDLQERTNSGHLSALDWYLLSRWTQSAPMQSVTHVVSHPYVAGGSAFVPPASVIRSGQDGSQQAFAGGGGGGASASRLASLSKPGVNTIAPPGGASAFKAPAFAAPSATNPYSVEAGNSRLGSKVNASFARAAGPRISVSMGQAGKGGMGSRVASFSAARGAARASSSISSSGVGHASVGHASGGSSGG